MNFGLTIFLFLWTTLCMGQSNLNQVIKISKTEFKKLKEEKDRFIPSDLGKTKVLFIKPTSYKFDKLERAANVAALHRNGYDTTSLTTNGAFTRDNAGYYVNFDKTCFGLLDRLKKKGIDSKAILEGTETNYSINDFRYLLKLDFVSTMSDPIKRYLVKPTFYFVDRVDNKSYEVFLPTNFYIWELMDKIK